MSSVTRLFALLSFLAKAAWVAAQITDGQATTRGPTTPFTTLKPTTTMTLPPGPPRRPSGPRPPGPDCNRTEILVQTDAANNSILTTSLNAAWNGWSRPDKTNFAMYKKRIENAVNEPVSSAAQKISGVSKILESYAPDGSTEKDRILAIPIAGWGTFCDFLNCAIRRGYLNATEKDCWKFTPTTPWTTTTLSPENYTKPCLCG